MPSPSSLGKQSFDPLQHDIELPFCNEYFPLGFRVFVESNSPEVLAAADESWGMWRREFECEPVRLRIIVHEEGELALEPQFRSQGHLLTIVSDRANHACVDLKSLFGYAFVSQATAADHAWLRWYFLEAMAYCALSQRYTAPIHAAAVARRGVGVLLFGESAAGKSTLAFACARAGWTFISDDASSLLQESEDRTVIGKPHQVRFRDDAPRFFPEIQDFVTRARPNGKISIEVPTSAFPNIQTATSCEVGCTVVLQRGRAARIERISPDNMADRMTSEACFYGYEVRARHERAIRRIFEKPVYRMEYETLEEAIAMLEEVVR